jgi:hypothetical protein
MASAEQVRQVYEDLAYHYDRQGQAKQRDWFLVLAADSALFAGRPDEAERLRGRLLHANPHHLLRPFDSFADALKSPDIQGYVADLRRIYPPDAAAQLLQEQRQLAAATAPADRTFRPVSKASTTALAGLARSQEEPEVQVFRLETLADEPRTAPPPRPAPVPPVAPPKPLTASPAVGLPRERPSPRPLASRLPTPAAIPWTVPPPTDATPEETDPMSAWVALTLFVILLVSGLGLAGYVLVRPLLLDWFS